MISRLGFLTIAISSPSLAGIHPPEIEARLAPIVDDWTIEGHERTYREHCSWYGDRAFVVCNTTDSSDNSASVSIIGYSKANGHFTYHNYSGSGSSRSEIGFPVGDRGLVFTGERKAATGVTRVTSELTPVRAGQLRFRQHRSVNGGPWSESADFHYLSRSNSK